MKKTLQLATLFFAVSSAAHAQVAPAATGPGGIPLSGDLKYSLRYSQSAEFSDTNGDWTSSTASGSVDYTNGSVRLPFSLGYSGGYRWNELGTSYSSGFFHALTLSQGLIGRKWSIVVGDSVGYRPASPTVGTSGVAGTGDVTGSNSSSTNTQSILTVNTHVLNNDANGQVQRMLDHATTIHIGGGSDLLNYPDGNGLDTNSWLGDAGLSRRLNARNSLTADYMLTQYSYSATNYSIQSQSGLFGFNRTWNRKISTNVSAGPQWVSSSDSTQVPSSTRLSVNAGVVYQYLFTSFGLNYTQGTSSGGGFVSGAEMDSIRANYSRELSRNFSLGANGSYTRTSGLNKNGETNGIYAGMQANRRLGQFMSAFASYTASRQSSSLQSSSTINNPSILNGIENNFSVGIGFTPREKHLRN